MKSSSSKILSLIRRSFALSKFLRIWQTITPQFICLFILRSGEAGRDWRKIALKLKRDRTSDLKSIILAFNGTRCLTNNFLSSKPNFNLLSIIKRRKQKLSFGFKLLPFIIKFLGRQLILKHTAGFCMKAFIYFG